MHYQNRLKAAIVGRSRADRMDDWNAILNEIKRDDIREAAAHLAKLCVIMDAQPKHTGYKPAFEMVSISKHGVRPRSMIKYELKDVVLSFIKERLVAATTGRDIPTIYAHMEMANQLLEVLSDIPVEVYKRYWIVFEGGKYLTIHLISGFDD